MLLQWVTQLIDPTTETGYQAPAGCSGIMISQVKVFVEEEYATTACPTGQLIEAGRLPPVLSAEHVQEAPLYFRICPFEHELVSETVPVPVIGLGLTEIPEPAEMLMLAPASAAQYQLFGPLLLRICPAEHESESLKETSPESPPPDKPEPAVTEVISPAPVPEQAEQLAWPSALIFEMHCPDVQTPVIPDQSISPRACPSVAKVLA